MKNIVLLSGIHLGTVTLLHYYFRQQPEAIWALWLAAIVSYGILMPTYLVYIWVRKTSENRAIQIFYAGYLFRFFAFFGLLLTFQFFLSVSRHYFVPFLLFFYLFLLFVEVFLIFYEFSVKQDNPTV